MSTPPDLSEKPMARFIMDGILHNLARQQRLKELQLRGKRPRERSPESLSVEGPVPASAESPEKPPSNTILSRSLNPPLKGILKSPTVHFPEESKIPEDPSSLSALISPQSPPGAMPRALDNEISAMSGIMPLPPPPPPPEEPLPAPPPPPPKEAPRPPTMFNREIEASEYLNKAAYKLYTNFMDKLSEFVEQQGRVIKIRLAVQEKRQELRRLRENVSECDMLLINYLREHIADEKTSDDTRTELFEAALAARDLVGPKESEYEPLEIALGAAEHKLKQKYAAIQGRFEHFFRLNVTSTTKHSVPSEIEYEPASEVSESGEIDHKAVNPRDTDLFHGAFIGEDVGVGQLPLRAETGVRAARTKRDGRETRFATFSDDTQGDSRKNPSNATADEPNQDDVPTELLGITGAENTEITLKGVASHSIFDLVEDPGSLLDDLLIDEALTAGESLLLLEEDNATLIKLTDYLTIFESTRDRVNRWLLHQLRVSRRATYALRREVLDYSPGVSDWAILALSEWLNDSLGYGQSYHHGSIEDGSDSPALVRWEAVSAPHAIPSIPGAETPLEPEPLLPSNVALLPTNSDLHDRSTSTLQQYEVVDFATNSLSSTVPVQSF